jgi:hypothetical protein
LLNAKLHGLVNRKAESKEVNELYGFYRVTSDLGSQFIIMYRDAINNVIAVLDSHDIELINVVWKGVLKENEKSVTSSK